MGMNMNSEDAKGAKADGQAEHSVRRIWFTMVLVPERGWVRVGRAYASKDVARGWLPFVSEAWHGLRTKVAQCTLRWERGQMTPRSRELLSAKFNMEPPALPAPRSLLPAPCSKC